MIYIAEIILISISSALLSAFFINSMDEGQIFASYGKFLKSSIYKENILMRIIYPIRNPLGLCIYCNSTWIFIFKFVILFILTYDISFILTILYLLVGMGITFLFVKLYNKFIS